MKNNPVPEFRGAHSAKLVFLVGMPGAGKTYWGEKIAAARKVPFVDLDIFIAEQENASIPALFAMYGENGFREREQRHLKKAIGAAKYDIVVACGGGTPCFGDNMKIMLDAGTVIYLESDVALLLKHLKESTEVRPLLNNRGELGAYLEDLLKKRARFYEQANYILQVKDISLATFAKIISHV